MLSLPLLLPQEEGLLTLCPCSIMGSIPQETVFHELLQHGPFPWVAALHELLQYGSFQRGAVLQEQTASAWVPHGVTRSASKPALSCASLSTGPQILPEACSSVGFPQGHSLLQASPCSGVGSSPGCRWGSAPLWTSMGCRAQPDPPLSPPWAAGNLCSGAWSTSCPPSALTSGSAGLFLSHILIVSLHSYCSTAVFSPFLTISSQRFYYRG